MARKQKVAILGGGVAGIAAAVRLLSNGAQVRLYEEADALGGIYRPFQFGDAPWDRHPHRILSTDSNFLDFLDEVGAGSLVKWTEGRIGLRMDGKSWTLAEAKDVRRFTPLKLMDRLKLGLTVYKATKGPHPAGLENISAREWVVRQSGEPSWNLIFEPLLRLLLGDEADKASALFLRECMRRAAVSRYGAKDRKGYGYVAGGLRNAWEKVAVLFAERGATVSLGHGVASVRSDGPKKTVVGRDGTSEEFEQVFVTYPEPQARALLGPKMAAALGAEIPFLGMISMACVGDWSLSDHAITYHTSREVPFSGIVEMTKLVPTIEMSGRHLMFLMRFTRSDDPIQSMSDDQVATSFFAGLEKLYDVETRDGVRDHWVFREPAFRPVPVVGLSQSGPSFVTVAPGIHCMNTRLLHFGAADCEGAVVMARDAATAIAKG